MDEPRESAKQSGYVVGIDAGASRTRALALARDGSVLRSVETSGANFTTSADPETSVREALRRVVDPSAAPLAIALCAAGMESAEPQERALGVLAREAADTPSVVTHDAQAALYAASPHGVGVVLIAGTGAIAYGRDAAGREARASGWGYLIGDEGSLAWLGQQALRAAARSEDGRTPATPLLEAVRGELRVRRLREALPALYGAPHPAPALLAAALALGRAAAESDDVARRIIAQGAEELARAAAVVAEGLRLDEVFLSGGAFAAIPALEQSTRARLQAVLPGARLDSVRDEPARGAARIAALLAWGQPT